MSSSAAAASAAEFVKLSMTAGWKFFMGSSAAAASEFVKLSKTAAWEFFMGSSAAAASAAEFVKLSKTAAWEFFMGSSAAAASVAEFVQLSKTAAWAGAMEGLFLHEEHGRLLLSSCWCPHIRVWLLRFLLISQWVLSPQPRHHGWTWRRPASCICTALLGHPCAGSAH